MEKVWIYLSNAKLENSLLNEIKKRGNDFVKTWKAHENKLSATFDVINNYFIVVKVNEAEFNASGCSIDKLLRFIKELENEFSIQLLNRLLVAYKTESGVTVVPSSEIKDLLENEAIKDTTIVYDISVSTNKEFAKWEKMLKDTWLRKYLTNA